MSIFTLNTDTMFEALGLFDIEDGRPFEIAAIHQERGKTLRSSGRFSTVEAAVTAVHAFDERHAPIGFYLVVNPLTSKAQERVTENLLGPAAKDADIAHRAWWTLDLDVKDTSKGGTRPPGACATDEEVGQATRRASEVTDYLRGEAGWVETPLVVLTGNGVQIHFRTDLAAEDTRPRQLSRLLAEGFSSGNVEIDTAVSNVATLVRLPGTINRKAALSHEGRAHRTASIASKPEGTVSPENFDRAIALLTPKRPGKKRGDGHTRAHAGSCPTLEEVEDALDFLLAFEGEDPLEAMGLSPIGIERHQEWVNLAIALRNTYAGTGKEEAAFALFDHCSSRSDKYMGTEDCRQTWDSIELRGDEGLTVSTVFKHSRLRGWIPPEVEQEADELRRSQADLLVDLVLEAGVELFHAHGDGDGFASIQVGGHRETWPVSSSRFKTWLRREFHARFGKALRAQVLTDALGAIEAKATFDGEDHEVALRVAGHDGQVYIDLGDEEWQVVRVTSEGWEIVPASECPVRFTRRRGMLALPLPVAAGRIDQLRPLVNLPDDDAWVLFVATLVAYLLPHGPYPVLVVGGEQGSAKSFLTRIARRLIDPNEVPLRRPPKDDRDLFVAATSSWIVAFDNLSGIGAGLSDALCTLATGGGFATRALYTDGEEVLFSATRPVLLNGIDDAATRPDLLDRAVVLRLPTIREDARRAEADLWREFETIAPRVLGALLDAVSSVLRNRGSVQLHGYPRMADFAIAATAAEEGLAWPSGTFMQAYAENRREAQVQAIEEASIGTALLEFLEEDHTWTGTAQALLATLEGRLERSALPRPHGWPKNPRGLSAQLRRIAPPLRSVGVEVEMGQRDSRRKRARLIRLTRRGGTDGPADGCGRSEGANRPTENGLYDPDGVDADGSDGSDGPIPTREDGTGDGHERAYDSRRSPACEKGSDQPSAPSAPSAACSGDPENGEGHGRSRTVDAAGRTVAAIAHEDALAISSRMFGHLPLVTEYIDVGDGGWEAVEEALHEVWGDTGGEAAGRAHTDRGDLAASSDWHWSKWEEMQPDAE